MPSSRTVGILIRTLSVLRRTGPGGCVLPRLSTSRGRGWTERGHFGSLDHSARISPRCKRGTGAPAKCADTNRAKLPHKSSAARTSCLPRAQVVCRPHRMPGRAHKSSDARTDRRDARTDSQDCRTDARMSAQVAGRAHSAPGPSVLVVCHAHRLPDTRTGRLTFRLRNVTSPGRKLNSLLRKLSSRVRKLIECGRSLIKRTRSLPAG
jgi:hypothetical protein